MIIAMLFSVLGNVKTLLVSGVHSACEGLELLTRLNGPLERVVG